MRTFLVFLLGILVLVGSYIVVTKSPYVFAAATSTPSINELNAKINDSNARLADIEKEIESYQSELKKVGGQKNTLQNTINRLQLEQKKIQADIRYTQNKISATDLELEQLGIDIGSAKRSIDLNERAVGETLRSLNEQDDNDMVSLLLKYSSLADFWNQIDQLQQVRSGLGNQVKDLVSQKQLLESKQADSEAKRSSLVSLKNQYSDQNSVLQNNAQEKNKLLSATKNQEANYQKLLKDKQAARDAIEKEIRSYESQLQFILDPNSIPPKGTAVFNWPLNPPVIITQLFGGTEFAKQNAGIYGNRPYHPGIDLNASVGTPIHAPLAGTVRATGNTDLVPGCYSWGKWTLIDHTNGLSTLYAHQSLISVTPGQKVNTGDIIGYSGNTGYSTGPHLHFTVYVKAGVSVRKFNEIKAVTGCGPATTPVAAVDAYIDPLQYLPKDFKTAL